MSWIIRLAETYDNCSDWIGQEKQEGNILLPISHSTQNAQIEIRLDDDGNFRGARRVPKEEAETIIPVTEESGSRANGISPHPLCDKLFYIAGDYETYVMDTKNRDYHTYFMEYIKNLKKWVDSRYTNTKVYAIYTYLTKESVMQDLLREGVLKKDEQGQLLEKEKIAGINQADAFVRFIVEVPGNYDVESSTWKDETLFQDFIKFYAYSLASSELCYATGLYQYCSERHPSKIRNSADKSKLISANDSVGFTYRGRFASKEEANSISYEISQKAHNMLKWLIRDQRLYFGDMVLVAWGTAQAQAVNVLGQVEDEDVISEEQIEENDLEKLLQDEVKQDSTQEYDGKQLYRNRLRRSVYFGDCDLEDDEHVVVMTLEAATTGRLSITYYKEMAGSSYKRSIQHWHDTCVWHHWYMRKGGGRDPVTGTPSLKDIALCAYGTDRDGILKVNDKLKKSVVSRLIPLVIDRSFRRNSDGTVTPYPYEFPKDIVERLIYNASRPISFSQNNRGKILTVACAVINKYYYEKGVQYEMDWKERRDREFLFGRLLAIAEMVERESLGTANKGGYVRNTNAERLMNAFRKRPFTTWTLLSGKIRPYLKSLGWIGKIYQDMIDEVISSFLPMIKNGEERSQFENDSMLNGSYLLGYSLQKRAGRFGGKKKSEDKEITVEAE